MNFSPPTLCLLVMSACLIAFGQITDAAQIKANFLEALEAASEEPAEETRGVPEQTEDLSSESGLVDERLSSPEEDEETAEEMSVMELEDFLSQFVLIKTPYGYILGRAAPSGEITRVRRGRQQAEKNFQLRVRRADRAPYNSNFQLRVRKNGQTQQQNSNLSNVGLNNGRVRKAIMQEIKDRRRMAADNSNNNFQLRVRKSQERKTRSSAGKNFQLRVRRSTEW